MTHRVCPRCGRHFAVPARYCTQDGSVLSDLPPTFPSPEPTTPRRTPTRTPRPSGTVRIEGAQLAGRYTVGTRLAEGGMGFVYRGTDTQTDRPVAVKVLLERLRGDSDAIARLRREARLALQFDHPNLCPILAQGEIDRMPYLVMPLLEGETLERVEAHKGRFTPEEGVPILVQIADGLASAHALGILHRDLKPENIMLVPVPEGVRAVVMDFGLATNDDGTGALERLTATGVVLGTPEFMSPEQISGNPLDQRSDIYALGVLGFEMFTGDLPFIGDSAQELMVHHLTGTPRRLRELDPTLPADLNRIIAQALATRPADRFRTMGALRDALRTAILRPSPSR